MMRDNNDTEPAWVTEDDTGNLVDYAPSEGVHEPRPQIKRSSRRSAKNRPPPNFRMPPPQLKRGALRWILLALHVAPFVVFVLLYPQLADAMPDVFTGNMPWLIIPIWTGVLILHVLIVVLLELRESITFSRTVRRRRQEYEAHRSQFQRKQMKHKVRMGMGTRTDTPNR